MEISTSSIKNFDTREADKNVQKFVDDNFKKESVDKVNRNRISFLVTQIFDCGGHSECVRQLVSNLSDTYEIKTFMTKLVTSFGSAPKKMNAIKQHSKIDGINAYDFNPQIAIDIVFNRIVEFAPKVIFVVIQPEDFLGAAVLALIKKYTNIKVIYFNHSSHFPALGFNFSDIVIVAMPSTHYIDKTYRKIDRHYLVDLLCDKIEDIKYFSDEEIQKQRQELGIEKDGYCTMSGFSSYKIFEGEKSPYLDMIKRLLIREEKLKHVIISDFSTCKNIDQFFDDPKLRERVIILPFTNDYEILFQSCDVFIDSFPISSALTQIDLMKFKKPTVVKINRENALWSFDEYMPKDYPYMFDNVEELEEGILRLLYDKEERQKVVDMNYEHYMKKFEGNVVKQKYVNLIENSDNIEQLYVKLDENIKYNLVL